MWVRNFITECQRSRPKADERILKFIAKFLISSGKSIAEVETLRHTFRSGYCYYFAMMLKDAFPEGQICWAAPYGHIVYMKDNIPYDIDGIYEGEAEVFVPIAKLGEAINDFRHIDGLEYNITDQEIARIMLEEQEIENDVKMYGTQY